MNPTMMKKLVVSVLALGVATSAVVFGSMAAWTASTSNSGNSVKTGSISLTNTKDATAIINATNVKPGDVGQETVTIGNGGSIPLNLSVTQSAVVQGASNFLKLRVFDGTNCVYPAKAGPCTAYGEWNGGAGLLNAAAGSLAAGASKTFTVGYTLEADSTNADQNKTNTFTLTFDGVPA